MNFLEDGHPYLYGKLNKEVELVKLKGKETPTTTTEIDEENNIGVNVKDSIIIGDSYINDSNELIIESRDKLAAPLVTIQLGDFKQEQSDMAVEDESNETFIKNKSTKYLKNEGEDGSSKYTTEAALNIEIDRAKNAEAVLDTKITTETNRAINKENELNESIANEVSRATESENILDTKITDETNRAINAEDALKARLNDFGLTQGDQKYSIVQKRIKSDGSIENTEAYQRGSMSVGGGTVAGDKSGTATDYSFAFAANENNEAIARSSAAFGRYNKTFNPGEFVCGNYSEENRNAATVFLVGGGFNPDRRHNAFEVRTDHSTGVDISSAYVGGKMVATREYVNNTSVHKEGVPCVVYATGKDEKGNVIDEVIPYRFSKTSITEAEFPLMFQPMVDGRLYTRDPIDDYHATNKKFVNAGLDAKYDKTGGVINGEVVITGDLTVNGTQHINNTENLDVKNAMIYSNSDGATLASNGGLGIKTNSTDIYGIVYDPAGDSVKLGLGKSDADGRFTFNANEGNPITVRDDDNKLPNNHLLKWNSTNRKLVDSGKTTDDFVQKDTSTTGFTVYGRVNGVEQNIQFTTSPSAYTIAYRDANGSIEVSDPNSEFGAANKRFVDAGLNTKYDKTGGVISGDTTITGRAKVLSAPKENEDVTRWADLIAKPVTETETIIVDTTTVSFVLDTEHDTGMYVSAENAISLGSTQGWDSGRAKYKVIWDGVEYIVYGQSSNVTRMTDLRPTSYYGWQLLGNGSNAKLMMYNKDTLDIPFAITQDRWKNAGEWLVYATTSTAATHTIKVIKVEGTYDKITPEYQYGYLSLVSQNKQNAFIYGTNSIPDRFDGFVAAPGNTVVIDDASKGVSNCIITADGSYVNVSSANGELNSPAITGSFNSLYISGLLQSPSLAGQSNQIKNNGAAWLAPFVAGYKNNVTADKGTIHPDAVFGSFNEVTYSGNSSYGLNLLTGNKHKVKNVSLSLVAGLANTVECLTADNYISASLVGGQQNIVNHSRVVMGGARNKSDRNNQFVAGIYSATNEKALVKIGNGTADDARANAFEVLDDSRAKVYGAPVEDTDVVRFLELKSKLDNSSDSFIGANGVTVTSENNKIKINADGCVQKYADNIGVTRLYGNTAAGVEHAYIVATSDQGTTPERISMYRASDSGTVEPNGYLICHSPENDYQTTNKLYVDNISATYIDVDLIGA